MRTCTSTGSVDTTSSEGPPRERRSPVTVPPPCHSWKAWVYLPSPMPQSRHLPKRHSRCGPFVPSGSMLFLQPHLLLNASSPSTFCVMSGPSLAMYAMLPGSVELRRAATPYVVIVGACATKIDAVDGWI